MRDCLLWLALGGLLPQASLAQDTSCRDYLLPEQLPVQVLQVGDQAPRTHFVKNPDDQIGCPAAGPACQRKAYLVPGDRVLAGQSLGDWRCAVFFPAKGGATTGWLPAAGLGPPPQVSFNAADFAGEWRRDEEASLSFKLLPGEKLEVSGYASYGSQDPERVARGAVNVGEVLPTTVSVDGAVLVFEPEVGNIDPAQAGEYSCILWLQRLRTSVDLLVVRDNHNCGGMNVSFSGIYRR